MQQRPPPATPVMTQYRDPACTAELEGYCRRRLEDDPHLSIADLHREAASLSYRGNLGAFYYVLKSRQIRRADCRHCARFLAGTANGRTRRCQLAPSGPLPMRTRPVHGEMLVSYLWRLAAANHIHLGTVVAALPAWFATAIWKHHPSSPGAELTPAATAGLDRLAALTGRPVTAYSRALPAFGGGPAGPARLTTACRRCAAGQGTGIITVYRSAFEMACTRHRLWLPAPGLAQLDISACPEIISASDRSRKLLAHHTSCQVLFAQVTAGEQLRRGQASGQYSRTWQEREQLLRASNPQPATSAAEHELRRAAKYPDIIELAAGAVHRADDLHVRTYRP
jgi:TniQ